MTSENELLQNLPPSIQSITVILLQKILCIEKKNVKTQENKNK